MYTKLYLIIQIQHIQTSRDTFLQNINPQTLYVFRKLKTPKVSSYHPSGFFAFPSEFFGYISYAYVFGVKKSNGDNENIISSLHDLENQGLTLKIKVKHFCLISGCKHDINSILV